MSSERSEDAAGRTHNSSVRECETVSKCSHDCTHELKTIKESCHEQVTGCLKQSTRIIS
jgi:hypothetical protein